MKTQSAGVIVLEATCVLLLQQPAELNVAHIYILAR